LRPDGEASVGEARWAPVVATLCPDGEASMGEARWAPVVVIFSHVGAPVVATLHPAAVSRACKYVGSKATSSTNVYMKFRRRHRDPYSLTNLIEYIITTHVSL